MDEEFTLDEDVTPEEMEALKEVGYGFPQQEEKQNIYNYFKKVISMIDNSKTGNLTDDEIGLAKVPVRTNQEIAHYCKAMGMGGFANYFNEESQITLSTSLSREGFLDKLAVTQKREMETKRKNFSQAQKKNWFTKKPKQEEF